MYNTTITKRKRERKKAESKTGRVRVIQSWHVFCYSKIYAKYVKKLASYTTNDWI